MTPARLPEEGIGRQVAGRTVPEVTAISWDELQARSTARQFPADLGAAGVDVAGAVARLGPMQTQTARSAFVALGARAPGIDHASVTAAYEAGALVRGSSIRGTVHTSTPDQHRLLEAATATGLRILFRRDLGLDDRQVDFLFADLDRRAADAWHPAEDLVDHLRRAVIDLDPAGEPRAWDEVSPALARIHGGLIRRPASGGWDRQTKARYRTADAVVDRGPVPADPLAELVRLHLTGHGPSSRQDLAWWAGVGVTVIDPVLERLGAGLVAAEGPDGRIYHDVATGMPDGATLDGVRLLPEFDAVLCAYEPSARRRFVDDDVNAALWNRANGLVLPPVLVDGRIGGHWRAAGSSRRRPLTVTLLGRCRRPRKAELADAVAALEAALDLAITEVTVERA